MKWYDLVVLALYIVVALTSEDAVACLFPLIVYAIARIYGSTENNRDAGADDRERLAREDVRRRALLDRIHLLSGVEFEEMSADLFRHMGLTATVTQRTRDGGVDLVLRDGQRTVLVQCKRQSQPVGVKVVRELFGVLIDKAADKAIVVTNGSFTSEAEAFARGKRLELVDGALFTRLYIKYVTPDPVKAPPEPDRATSHSGAQEGTVAWDGSIPGIRAAEKALQAFVDSGAVRSVLRLGTEDAQVVLELMQASAYYPDVRKYLRGKKVVVVMARSQSIQLRATGEQLRAARDADFDRLSNHTTPSHSGELIGWDKETNTPIIG